MKRNSYFNDSQSRRSQEKHHYYKYDCDERHQTAIQKTLIQFRRYDSLNKIMNESLNIT